MLNIFRNKLIFFLSICLLFSLIGGCGLNSVKDPAVNGNGTPSNTNVPGGDVTGTDWRTYRGYSYGNITGDISVLYFHYDEDIVRFYNDDSTQTPILDVDLSGFDDPSRISEAITFKDVNGDGYNDLCVPLAPDDERHWLWDPEEWCFVEENR